jgi:hypothetical protein
MYKQFHFKLIKFELFFYINLFQLITTYSLYHVLRTTYFSQQMSNMFQMFPKKNFYRYNKA